MCNGFLAAADDAAVVMNSSAALLPKLQSGCQPSTNKPCIVIHEYHASAWEAEWIARDVRDPEAPCSCHNWRHRPCACRKYPKQWPGCKVLERANEMRRVRRWLKFATRLQRSDSSKVPNWPLEVFSHHAYRNSCTCQVVRVPIEPLVGFLRHPCAICLDQPNDRWAPILTKEHMLPTWRGEVLATREVAMSSHDALPPRNFLFDLGASTYRYGTGGDSQRWLVEAYERRGLIFDRIFAWEATPHEDRKIFNRMPTRVLDVLSYYNVPIDSSTPDARHNPLRTLRTLARPNDFVVIKVDYDDCVSERALIEQIIQSPETSRLVTELYFEHHVLESPMDVLAWHVNSSACGDKLRDSFALFGRLRAAGIRAHPWV